MTIYMDWGTYDLRSPHEAWDMVRDNRKAWSDLREAGYRPAGGEAPEGPTWQSWRSHTDEMLAALVPQGRYDEIADVILTWYGGLASRVTFPVPADPAGDGQAAEVVAALRRRP